MPKKSKLDLVDKVMLVCATFLLSAALYTLYAGRKGIEKPRAHIDTSIVRLHDAETGRFFCSGVVISDVQILTAAHCIVRDSLFGLEVVKKVEIRAVNDTAMGLYAEVVAANPRQDVAMLSGNFSLFDHMSVEIKPQALEDSYLKSKHLKACGYPAGGALVCTQVKNVKHQLFGFSADGFLYPGMSGGPVIDEETGMVIGVNTAVFESRIYLSPTEELYQLLRP